MCRRTPGQGDAGFTVVEVIVAITIAGFVFLSMGLATIAAMKGTLTARQNQLAVDLGTQALERVRALDYADVTLVTGDSTLSGDPRVVSGSRFDPGTGTAEDLVLSSVGTLNPHQEIVSKNSVDYSIWAYVTEPDGVSTEVRRVTIVVTWPQGGKTRSKSVSTLVTQTRRGLPLPRFQFTTVSASALTLGPSTEVVYGFRVKNYGARDAWNLATTSGLTWTFYLDADKDGVLDGSETTQLADSDANGAKDTGAIAVNGEQYFLAVATAPGTVGGPTTHTFTLTSAAQPAAASASQSQSVSLTTASAAPPTPTPTPTPTGTPTPTPTPSPTGSPAATQTPWPLPTASCSSPPCTLSTVYWLHELPVGSHANNGSNTSSFDTSSVLQATSHDYSVGKPGALGRYLDDGGALLTDTNRDKVGDWRMQAPAKLNFKAGQAVVTLYVGCVSGSGPLTVNVAIGQANGTAYSDFTSRGTGTATLLSCTSAFAPVVVPVTVTDFSVTKNKYAVLRVTSAAASPDVRVGYDWGSAASSVVIPQ